MAGYRRNTQRRSNRRGQQSSSLGWVWLFLGMFIGLAGALFAYGVYTQQWSFTGGGRHKATAKNTAAIASTQASTQLRSQRGPVHVQVQNKNGSHQDYEFYTLLPGMEVQLPDPEATQSVRKVAKSEEPKVQTQVVSVQAAPHESKAEHSKTRKETLRENKLARKTRETTSTKSQNHTTSAHVTFTKTKTATPTAGKTIGKSRDLKSNTTKSHSARSHLAQHSAQKESSTTHKHRAPVLNLAPKNEVPKHETPKVQKKIAATRYIIQAGIFREANEAESLKTRLASQGFKSLVQKVKTQDGNYWFRVTLGPYKTEPAAVSLKKRLEAQKIRSILILQRTLE